MVEGNVCETYGVRMHCWEERYAARADLQIKRESRSDTSPTA